MAVNVKMTARRAALEVLTHCERQGGYSSLSLDSVLNRYGMNEQENALTSALVYGVIQRRILLDYYITRLCTIGESKIEPDVRNILRLGLYQLIYLDRIPQHAAVNECVCLCKKRSAGFVNAVLRGFLRKRDGIGMPDDRITAMSVGSSVPVPLCEKFIGEYGEERAGKILDAMNTVPPLTLRVNTLNISREELIKKLTDASYDAKISDRVPNGITLHGGVGRITALPGYENGGFFVQDTASQLCVEALGAKPGMTVIDCCSAPGSKSFGAAVNMSDTGRVLAFDLHENKLSLIKSGAAALGIGIIEASAHDSSVFLPELEKKADAVLCDVPCSGFGVMAKKPEIRYKPLNETDKLPEIQYRILDCCSGYVGVGGCLVYSTCTVFGAENRDVARRFLSEHTDFVPESFRICGNEYDAQTQLLPDSDGTDGFFIAKFRRKS